jgi:hypothetical protein
VIALTALERRGGIGPKLAQCTAEYRSNTHAESRRIIAAPKVAVIH